MVLGVLVIVLRRSASVPGTRFVITFRSAHPSDSHSNLLLGVYRPEATTELAASKLGLLTL